MSSQEEPRYLPHVLKSLASENSIWHTYNASLVDYSKPQKNNHVTRSETREPLVHAWGLDSIESLSATCTAPSLNIDESALFNGELAAWVNMEAGSMTSEANGARVFEAFWRTLMADKNDNGSIDPGSFAEIFSLLLEATTGRGPSLAGQTYSARQQKPAGR